MKAMSLFAFLLMAAASNQRMYPYRLTVEIPEQLRKRINRNIPHGTTKYVVAYLLEDICDKIEKDPKILGAILSKQYK